LNSQRASPAIFISTSGTDALVSCQYPSFLAPAESNISVSLIFGTALQILSPYTLYTYSAAQILSENSAQVVSLVGVQESPSGQAQNLAFLSDLTSFYGTWTGANRGRFLVTSVLALPPAPAPVSQNGYSYRHLLSPQICTNVTEISIKVIGASAPQPSTSAVALQLNRPDLASYMESQLTLDNNTLACVNVTAYGPIPTSRGSSGNPNLAVGLGVGLGFGMALVTIGFTGYFYSVRTARQRNRDMFALDRHNQVTVVQI